MKRYLPGRCNIGPRNRWGRFLAGMFSYAMGVWAWTFVAVNQMPVFFKVLLFVPFYLAFLGVYQGIFGFCIHHATKGTSDMR